MTQTVSFQHLYKSVPILKAEISALYQEFDQRFHLKGSKVPIEFGTDEEVLGSYKRATEHEGDSFYFNLSFIAYQSPVQLSKADREDLYRHEYAHYMQYHMAIPREYQFQPGIHGSAWKYCCSLTGAAPTPYYKVGESLQKHNYTKALHNPWKDPAVADKDRFRREKACQAKKAQTIQYEVGEEVTHPTFGDGTIENIVRSGTSVQLHINFPDHGLKKIDQKWLHRKKYS